MSSFEIEKNIIKSALGSSYEMFKEHKAVLAGGAITSLMSGKEVNDYDIYFRTKEALSEVFANIYNISSQEFLGQYEMITKFATKRSMLCIEKYSKAKIQLIHYKMHENIESIFNSFDYSVNMAAFDFATEEFVFHKDFWKAVSQRVLRFNPQTDFPVTSLMRVQKYKEKGYTISKAQMLRIAFTIASRDYSSWEKVKNEVSGLYGVAPDKLFDETKPFSLEEVVIQLEKVILSDKFVETSPEFEECLVLMKDSFSDNFNTYIEEVRGEHPDTFYFHDKCTDTRYNGEKNYCGVQLTDVVKAWAITEHVPVKSVDHPMLLQGVSATPVIEMSVSPKQVPGTSYGWVGE